MAKSMLIAPADGRLGTELIEQYVQSGWNVTAGYTGTEFPGNTGENDHLSTIAWDPRSFISSRNLLLTALNRWERLDAALIVDENTLPEEPLHLSSPLVIETNVDATLKGAILLTRVLLAAMLRNQAGRLSLVHFAPEEHPSSSLGTMAKAALDALWFSLREVYQDEPILINTFETKKPDIAGYTQYILSEEFRSAAGGVHRFGGNPLNRISLRKQGKRAVVQTLSTDE